MKLEVQERATVGCQMYIQLSEPTCNLMDRVWVGWRAGVVRGALCGRLRGSLAGRFPATKLEGPG